MADYHTDVASVRSEIEADGYELPTVSGDQIEAVGLVPAHLEVEEDLADEGMSNDRLALIERYLAADYLLSSDIDGIRRAASEADGDGSSVDYESGHGYRAKAKRLDKSGRLDSLEQPDAFVGTPDARGPTTGGR